jgi:thioredoxin-like negative regulator of GroEL
MRRLLAAAAAASALLLVSPPSDAKRDAIEQATPAAEVIVFEMAGCHHCVAFRDNLGARYLASTLQRAAPMRFVDIDKSDPASYPLATELRMLPTIVLIKNGREIDRLEGYPVPEIMFAMVKDALASQSD